MDDLRPVRQPGETIESFTNRQANHQKFVYWTQAVAIPDMIAKGIVPFQFTKNYAIAFGTIIENARGGSGKDTLSGNEANNILEGGAGDDTLVGNGGDDRLWGGDGADTLTGGNGADHFVFDGFSFSTTPDVITDFTQGEDRIVIQGGAIFIGTAAFTGRANEVRVATASGNTLVEVDGDGDKDADFTFKLTGTHALTIADFNWNVGQNSAPVLSPIPAVITTAGGQAVTVSLTASDDNFDLLAETIKQPKSGTVLPTAEGKYTNTPNAGFKGDDSFTVTVDDGRGGVVSKTVNITVTDLPEPIDFRMFLPTGFVGAIGGDGQVFGTSGFQDITVADVAGKVVLDPSFNKGGDILRLAGNAFEWQIGQVGSSALLVRGDSKVQVPIGTVGLHVEFEDGVRILRYDSAGGVLRIGFQVFDEELAVITASPQQIFLPFGADANALGRVFLAPEAKLTAGGKLAIFGTSSAETVSLIYGDVTLDPSFNKGGDTITLPLRISSFLASLSGSNAFLDSANLDVRIPVGTTGSTVSFASHSVSSDDPYNLTLRYSAADGGVMLGTFLLGIEPEGFATIG